MSLFHAPDCHRCRASRDALFTSRWYMLLLRGGGHTVLRLSSLVHTSPSDPIRLPPVRPPPSYNICLDFFPLFITDEMNLSETY